MYVKLHWDATAFSAGLTSVEHKIRLGGPGGSSWFV